MTALDNALEDMRSDEMIESFVATKCAKCRARRGCVRVALEMRDEERVASLRKGRSLRTGEPCDYKTC